MVTTADFQAELPPTCSVNIPKEGDTLSSYLSHRWMGVGPSTLPTATLTPSTDDDVVAAVNFAGQHGLRVIPKCGGMGGLVVLNERALYLDMIRFNDVHVNPSARTVTVGGGVLSGKLMKVVLDAGCYTGWANYSNVGVVGNLLLGGLNLFIGKRGFSCDHVVGARVVTGAGTILEVTAQSTSEHERQLLHMLKGGGVGLGVVLSLTLRIYPLAELGLVDNACPSVVVMFGRDRFSFAAELWERAARAAAAASSSPGCRDEDSPPLSSAFVMGIGPPGTPLAGQPAIMVHARCPASPEVARAAFAPLLTDLVRSRAAVVMDPSVPLLETNKQADMMTARGLGDMDCFNSLVESLSGAVFLKAANRWLEFFDAAGGDKAPPLKVMTVFGLLNTGVLSNADPERESAMCYRDRGAMVQTVFWDIADEKLRSLAVSFSKDLQNIVRAADKEKGLRNATLPAVGRVLMDMGEVYKPEVLAKLLATKQRVDPKSVFWSPAVDGWSY